jgi:zinc protease
VAEIFLRRALYGSHRLGERAGGSSADLLGLDAAAVRAAFNQFCRQELIVGWAGDITPEQAEQHTAQLVAARQKAQQPLGVPPPNPVVVAAVPPLQAPKVLLVDKPDRTQAQLRLGALGPLLPNPDCEAFWLAVLAFGGTFTSPFTREVRDERGWSYVAHADYRRQARLAAPVTLRCAPALEDAAACMALTIRLYGDLARGKLDDPLVDNVRHYILNRYPFEVATAFDMLGAAMAQELCLLPQGHLFGLPDRLQALSNEATRSAPTRHLQAAAYAAVVVAPSASLLPALRQALGKQVEIEVVDYQAGVGQITPA